ncbi:MAG: hypothetical protein N3E47_05030 [Candidatus Bathyarchaeota archaeon]|nr:hypothetical protein [Candidatus Bathyarchaeota archaeon]
MVEDIEVRKIYAKRIIELWLETLEYSQSAQALFLRGELENEVITEYVSRLVRLWRELLPKVKNMAEVQELEKEFMLFEEFCIANPRLLIGHPEKLVELEMVLTAVLDKLGVTQLDTLK